MNSPQHFWNAIPRKLKPGLPIIMGILNATPDSFYARSSALGRDLAAAADRLLSEGAEIIDIGGESTRPGALYVSAEEELRRILPAIRAVRERSDVPISVDTRKRLVLEQALDAGANILNDISALEDDPGMMDLVVAGEIPAILMHKQGNPDTMQLKPQYGEVVEEVSTWLESRVAGLLARGYPAGNVLVDPGFGFGKNFEHNLAIFRALPSIIQQFGKLGVGVLAAFSRKSFLGTILAGSGEQTRPAEERLFASLAASIRASAAGARVLRVHDVRAVSEALSVWAALGSED